MGRKFEITHLEYHPIGSEEIALECRTVGHDEDGAIFLLDGSEAVPLSVEAFDRRKEELLALPVPISADESFSCLTFGVSYISALRTIGLSAEQVPAVDLVTKLPSQGFGVRVFVAPVAECNLLASEVAASVVRAFDEEVRAGRSNGPYMKQLWGLIAQDTLVSPIERVVRGLFLKSVQRDPEGAEALILDAQLFDGLPAGSIERAAVRYRGELRPRMDLELVASRQPSLQDSLALNAKMDLLTQQVADLRAEVRQGSPPAALPSEKVPSSKAFPTDMIENLRISELRLGVASIDRRIFISTRSEKTSSMIEFLQATPRPTIGADDE